MSEIQSVAQWIGSLLLKEAKYLLTVRHKVYDLRNELDWMQCFLRQTDASQYENDLSQMWISQIRECAYDAEDTIDKFKFVDRVIDDRSRSTDFLSLLKKCKIFMGEAIPLHEIGSEIETLKQKLSHLTAKLQIYGINTKGETSSSWISRLRTETWPEEEDIIGREQDKDQLIKVLLSGEGGQRVLCISGVSGVGKTFLAKNIFHDSKIRQNFDAFAWAYVSQPCQSIAIQQDLLRSLTSKSKEQIAQMEDSELKDELCKVQCRYRCFIVLDGIWEKEVWDCLKQAFPITSHHYKSKLLITSELDEVAMHVHGGKPNIKLECFNDRDSRSLLEKKLKGHTPAYTGPIELKDDLLKKMREHCGGLPLVISVLGQVLASKQTMKEWEEVYEYIISHEYQSVKWKRILELSYDDLPYQLKLTFRYLGYFPANLEIPTTKIFRLWEAEGFDFSGGDVEISEGTLEDVAEQCLRALVKRSLLQVGAKGLTGRVKTFLVHDLVRYIYQVKASHVDWLGIFHIGAKGKQPSRKSSEHLISSRSMKKSFRRMAFYCSPISRFPSDKTYAPYVRSFLIFNTLAYNEKYIALQRVDLNKQRYDLKLFFDLYKYLRVLDIENIEVDDLPSEVGFLTHLRYLSLRGSWVSKLPSTISDLWFLQTLDLRVLSFVHLRIPNVLWTMKTLVHLYLPSKSFTVLPSRLCSLFHKEDKLRLSGLIYLRTLSNFSNRCNAEDVGRLRSLRKFSSCDFLAESEIIKHLLGIPSQDNHTLEHVEHLSLRLQGHLFKEYSAELGRYNKLYKLRVKGEIAESLPSGMLAENLIKISFQNSKFQIDPMKVLEKLPHLKKLSLKHASYMGTKMKCSKRGFPELSHLNLKGLENLKEWELKDGAMPNLSHLKITDCQKLEMIPQGMKSVKNLREFTISFMPFSFFERLSPMQINKWSHYSKLPEGACIKISHVLELQEGSSP